MAGDEERYVGQHCSNACGLRWKLIPLQKLGQTHRRSTCNKRRAISTSSWVMPSRSKPSVISNTTDGDDRTRRAQSLLNSKGKGNPSTTFPIKDVGTYRPSAASGSFIESNGEILCNRMPKVKPYTAAQGYP